MMFELKKAILLGEMLQRRWPALGLDSIRAALSTGYFYVPTLPFYECVVFPKWTYGQHHITVLIHQSFASLPHENDMIKSELPLHGQIR